MRVLLVSTYELGHQPLHLASPAAALMVAGHEVRGLDLSVDRLDGADLGWAEAVAFSVPMHTAMRLALRAAEAVRATRPELPICLFGLYAPVSAGLTTRMADALIAGEVEPELVRWADGLAARRSAPGAVGDSAGRPSGPSHPGAAGDHAGPSHPGAAGDHAGPSHPGAAGRHRSSPIVDLGRHRSRLPARSILPPLERYAHLAIGGEHRPVGYVEASHGCVHRCRHCPVPVVYGGRIRIVEENLVLADIAQLVEAGARHITFGDPDFLNGIHHSRRVVAAMHDRFPALTFDCTVKVEHILRHESVWGEMAGAGCLFVVSAFETTNDALLARLDKGHTRADAARATALLRQHGIEVRPSFLPFTPWTTLGDLADICDFIVDHDLVGNVDPVQLSIRLLLPEGSLLLDDPELASYLDGYDAAGLSWRWHAADPAVDALQKELARLVAEAATTSEPGPDTFEHIFSSVYSAAGRPLPPGPVLAGAVAGRPRLTEPWFC